MAVIGEYLRMSAAEFISKNTMDKIIANVEPFTIEFDPPLEVPALSEKSLESKDYLLQSDKPRKK